LRFDTFELFSRFVERDGGRLGSPETVNAFVAAVRDKAEAAARSPTMLHGQRAQAIFERVAASIGACRLLKQEDGGGEIFYAGVEELHVPDFRIILPDGRHVLVEVKNFHPGKDGMGKQAMTASYLAGLVRYADVMGCELLLATYWVGWRVWTLVSPDKLVADGEDRVLDLPTAIAFNRLIELGDFMIGARWPLRLRLVADPDKPCDLEANGKANFTVLRAEFYSGEEQVMDPAEQRIAFTLMSFGDWELEGPYPLHDGDRFVGVEYESAPGAEERRQEDWDFVGSLSKIVTAMHQAATENEHGITSVRARFEPGRMGAFIPEGYKSKALQLRLMLVRPADDGS
jgi:hypothetical protein